jgi:hypothetical protein
MAATKSSEKSGTIVSSRKRGATSRKGDASGTMKAVEPAAEDAAAQKVARRKPDAGTAGGKRIAKRYLKTSPVCRVSFRLPAEVAPGECSVHVTGDFNGWEISATPMTRLKNGDYGVTVDLETGREYHFRYLIDGCRWENDWAADRYDPNPHGGFDSVVVV